MADNFISGNQAYVKLGATSYAFNTWRLPMDGGTKKFFRFGGAGQVTTPGGYSATPVVNGPYDAGNMPLSLGQVYELHLGYAPGVEIVVNARLSNIEYGVTIGAGGEPAGCQCTFDSHGEFGINFT